MWIYPFIILGLEFKIFKKNIFSMYFTTPVQNLTQKLAYALVPVQDLTLNPGLE
jgi:hypothetical protein